MSPNTMTTNEIIDEAFHQEQKKNRKEIYYDGYFYDITDFIRRHPGGNVILFYTEQGEDATQAIQQFHYRSWNKVETILKSFKKRPALPNELGFKPHLISKHEALNEDFKQLFHDVEKEGFFKPCIRHVILRIMETIALTFLSFGIFFHCKALLPKFLSTIFVGFAWSRYGWLHHECGHNSVTGRPKVDKFIQAMYASFALGGSGGWWNSQHNRHHAMPQRLEHDVDLSTLPYVAFHKRAVRDASKMNSFFVRFQGVLYWTLDFLFAAIAWRFVIHPRYSLHKKAYHELALAIPSLLFTIFYTGIFWYFCFAYWFAFFLGINFALSHSHLDVADEPTHFVEYSLTHTANIEPSLLVDNFMGYLNYQIEHHLFPTMPQFRQRHLCERVKALAEKHGLPYRVYSYPEAVRLAVKNLSDVGKELTGNNHFEKAT